ncbi:hypothetical protein KC19_VG062400 [Ceratodon purpureus]|uniref:Uncharacterized protein n=1 Tax=Ceratodon purpureus TaxID=3225 RepID=A0A8T0HMB6_CERPU|nr:hypothetical protein KC19_VG062400 [Ceratodon purpureus]
MNVMVNGVSAPSQQNLFDSEGRIEQEQCDLSYDGVDEDLCSLEGVPDVTEGVRKQCRSFGTQVT